jgi:peroxiredoxin
MQLWFFLYILKGEMRTILLMMFLQVGGTAPGFRLPDSSGVAHSLGEYLGKTVVLAFWSYKCPLSLEYAERLEAMRRTYAPRDVVILGVDSNSNETAAEIRRNSANLKIGFPILLDRDASLAEKLGATHTPSIFIIDHKGNVQYGGGTALAGEALDAILAGRPAATPETRPYGCAIRRK